MYQSYRNRITSHDDELSPLTIELTGGWDASTGTVNAHIEVLDEITQTSVVVQFMVYEDHLFASGHEWRFVVRDILTTESLGISQPGETAEFTRDFTLNSQWDENDIGVVVFVQSMSTKEVLQAAKLSDVITTWSAQNPTVEPGTDLLMEAVIENVSPGSEDSDFWLDVELPNGEIWSGSPALGPVGFNVPEGFSNTFYPSLFVPGNIPPWTFIFHGRVGQYPWDIWQTDSFEVTVSP